MRRNYQAPRTTCLPRSLLALCLALFAGSVGMLPAGHIAAATTYTVNALTDTGAGAGTTGDLRYAVTQVNAGSGGDMIQITASGTITLTSALPALAKDVTITGPGADMLTVSGNNHLTVVTVGNGITANVSDLTIANGFSNQGPPYDAAGLYNQGSLTLSHISFRNNNAISHGGGIFNSGSLAITNSAFMGNSANDGGAIYSSGSVNVAASTFTGNGAYGDCVCGIGFGTGGAIDSKGTLIVSTSTFSNNTAGGSGAGHVRGTGGAITISGTATITSSTFIANQATGSYEGSAEGGAIANNGTTALANLTISGNSVGAAFTYGGGIDNTGTLTVTNSTIAGNTAQGGGGIGNEQCLDTCTAPGATNLTNTIVAQNTGGDLSASAPGGFVGYYNLIDDAATAASITDSVQGNIVGHPANLGTLGDYGGPTQTIPLLPGSPAIDGGAPVGQGPYGNTVPVTDQRGIPRPQGNGVDIGAFEVANPNPLPVPRSSGSSPTPAPIPPPRPAGQSPPSGVAPLPLPRTGSAGSGTTSQPGGGTPTANLRPLGR